MSFYRISSRSAMLRLGWALAILLVINAPLWAQTSATPARIQFGWNLEADQKFAYIIHIPPTAVELMMKSGDEVESNMPPELVGLVSRIVVRISSQEPERSHSLTELQEYRNALSKANQRSMPGTAIANLAGAGASNSPNIMQIDRDRDRDVQMQPPVSGATPPLGLNPPPSLQFGAASNLQGNLNPPFRDRQAQASPPTTAAEFSSRPANPPATSSFSDAFPSTNSTFPSTSSAPLANQPTANRSSLDRFGGMDERSAASEPVGIAPPLSRPQLNPNLASSNGFGGFDSISRQSDIVLASNQQQPATTNLSNGSVMLPTATPTTNPSVTGSLGVGELSASDQNLRAIPTPISSPQRDKLLPILFMLSFVANVYMAILLSRLVTRYRSLLTAFRSGTTSFDGA